MVCWFMFRRLPVTLKIFWMRSSVVRASGSHPEGQRFKSSRVHHIELVASLGASPLASAGFSLFSLSHPPVRGQVVGTP